MKKTIKDYISDIKQEAEENDLEFDENDDPLSDVRDHRQGSLLSARNIAIALVATIIVFFGGYFAAFAMAHQKYLQTEAELAACRSSLESARLETSSLKDSIDVLSRRLSEMNQPDSISLPDRTQM